MSSLPKFVLHEVEDSLLNGVLGMEKRVSDVVISSPYLGAKEFNCLFKNNGIGRRPTHAPAIFKSSTSHKIDTMARRFDFCRVIRYDYVEEYNYSLIHVPSCTYEIIESLSRGDFKLEFAKYQYDIFCKNYITSHFVFETIFRYGYFKLYTDNLNFEYDVKVENGDSFSILKHMIIYINEVSFNEYRVKVEEISKDDESIEPNIVRISIWTQRNASSESASVRYFYDELMEDKRSIRLDRFLKFKKIKPKYLEKVEDKNVSLQEQVVRLKARLGKEGIRNGSVRECLAETGRDLRFLVGKLYI